MNPRTKRNLILIAVLVILVAAVTLWVKTPRTFEQAMGNGFDRETITEVHIHYVPLEGEPTLTWDVPAQDEGIQALLDLLESEEYILGVSEGGQQMILGAVYVSFIGPDGPPYTLFFVGNDLIQMDEHHYTTPGGRAFQQEILDLLLAQPYTLNQ